MAFAPHTTQKIKLRLNAQDVQKIKQYVTGMQNKSNVKFDHRKICIFFDTIKSVLGNNIFEGLLTFPLTSRSTWSINSTSDHWFHKHNTFSVSDCSLGYDDKTEDVYVESITIHFNKSIAITQLFDQKQQQFVGKMGLEAFSIFRIQRSIDPSAKSSLFKYEILPYRKSWSSLGSGQIFMFGFSTNPTAIEMVPIWMNFRKESSINTKHFPSSVERIWLFAKDDLMSSGSNVFHLILDHDGKSRLNTVIVYGNTRKPFKVNVKCNMQLSSSFKIENMSNQCEMTGYKKMKMTDNEDLWRQMLKQMQEEEEEDEYY